MKSKKYLMIALWVGIGALAVYLGYKWKAKKDAASTSSTTPATGTGGGTSSTTSGTGLRNVRALVGTHRIAA